MASGLGASLDSDLRVPVNMACEPFFLSHEVDDVRKRKDGHAKLAAAEGSFASMSTSSASSQAGQLFRWAQTKAFGCRS